MDFLEILGRMGISEQQMSFMILITLLAIPAIMLFLVIFIIIGLAKTAYHKNHIKIQRGRVLNNHESKLPYELKSSLLTEREQKFFKILFPVVTKYNLMIAVKPRLADFIESNPPHNYKKISHKHVDFLICDKTMKPLMAIELDDSTHHTAERVKRDKFVDWVYETVGLHVVHIYEYSYDLLDNHIMLRLTECQYCNGFLLLRQKGDNYFCGCSNFPHSCDSTTLQLDDAKRLYKSQEPF